ncbi:hypothetical protein C8A00DRAFT_42252 [Chaetomidium leptoderma]|uniref:Protein prenyltransferase n=1 Tax=Chaetomidium leptoderma TaxID=669021 RepID=A0AAN6ZY25_9PEZI|nr:hypothetical protein C8A00DRAFT_42252 [Chaetomidium leptoderma]
MSRALDQETVASLKKGDPVAAYQTISNLLVSPYDNLLEIEILGKTHLLGEGQYVVQDGCAVGISKLGLVQAFMVARKQLRDHLDGITPQTDDEVFAATAVILLFDPEYLTATNSRKRLIQAEIFSGGGAYARLEKEKRFVDSLLTSRLNRHTKSPTLWSHRRWLLGMFPSSGVPVDMLGDIRDVVFVAGERHPRNYYAWCHARFLMGLERSNNLPDILAAVQTWCFQHHTDISGWTFLYYLLNTEGCSGAETSSSTFTEVLNLVSSLRLANESVWVFLRTLAGSRLVGDEQYSQFLAVQAAVLETLKTPTDQAVLRAAADWCETYRHKSGTRLAGV